MKFSHLMVAGAGLVSMMSMSVAADAKEHRRYDQRYEQSQKDYHGSYRSDRDRRYKTRDRDHRRDRRGADRRRDGSYADMARRNFEYERDLQTCYRNGQRICP